MRDSAAGGLLEVEGLSKSFGALAAVDDISFKLGEPPDSRHRGSQRRRKDDAVQLDHRRVFFHADKGRVTFRGARVEKMAPHKIFRLGLARTFQKEASFAKLTVEQNVRLGAAFGAGLRGRALERAVDEALDRLGLVAQRKAFRRHALGV